MFDGFNESSDEELRDLVALYEKSLSGDVSSFFDSEQFEEIIEFYLQKNQIVKAKAVIDSAAELYPFSSSIMLKQAQVLMFENEFHKAIAMVERVRLTEPFNPDVFLILGNIYDEMGRYQEAIESYTEALKYESSQDEVYLHIAYTYENWEKYALAIDALKAALKVNYKNEHALNELAFCCDFADETKSVLAFIERFIDEHPYSYMAWYTLGVIQFRQEDYDKAITSFDYAIVINEDYVPAYLNMGNIYFYQERYIEAIEAFRAILSLGENDVFALSYIGNCYKCLDKLSEAKDYYKRAIKIDANYADAWFGLGTVYQSSDKHKMALDCFDKALKAGDEDHSIWFAMADSLAEMDETERAFEAYQKALDNDPTNTDYIKGYALFLREHDFVKEAISLMEGVFELEAEIEDAELHLVMAGLLLDSGKAHEAVFYMVDARELDPESKELFVEIFPEYENHYLIQEVFG